MSCLLRIFKSFRCEQNQSAECWNYLFTTQIFRCQFFNKVVRWNSYMIAVYKCFSFRWTWIATKFHKVFNSSRFYIFMSLCQEKYSFLSREICLSFVSLITSVSSSMYTLFEKLASNVSSTPTDSLIHARRFVLSRFEAFCWSSLVFEGSERMENPKSFLFRIWLLRSHVLYT